MSLFQLERSSGSKRPHSSKPSHRRTLGAETLERRALLAGAPVAAPTQNPIVLQATPSQPLGAEVPAGNTGNANLATNGPNPATSAGAEVANPYLGNNPWLDDLATLAGAPSAAGNATIYGPLDQPYFTSLQEYQQYEEAVNAIAAQQAAQPMAT